MALEIQVLAWDRHKNVAAFKPGNVLKNFELLKRSFCG